MREDEVFETRKIDQFPEAALRVGIGGRGNQKIVFFLVRPDQESARGDGAFQLIARENVAGRMFVGEKGEGLAAAGNHRCRVPVKMKMDGGEMSFAFGAAFGTHESGNFVVAQDFGGLQERVDIFFGDQRVVFGIDEQVVVVHVIRHHLFVRKRERTRDRRTGAGR